MSYSDYGSYNWEKIKGTKEWVYKPEWEDRSLISEHTEKHDIIHQSTGLKFGAVLQSEKNELENPNLPYYITGSHHSVIGDLDGFAVVSYKGTPKVLWKGELIDTLDYDDYNEEIWDKKLQQTRLKENFVPKIIEITRDNQYVKVLMDCKINTWSVAYIKTDISEKIGICGYGLGQHWWLNSDGNAIDYDNVTEEQEDDDNFIYPEKQPIEHWLREKECLDRCLNLLRL